MNLYCCYSALMTEPPFFFLPGDRIVTQIISSLYAYKRTDSDLDRFSELVFLYISLSLSQRSQIPLISPGLLICRLHHSHHSSLAPVLLCLYSRSLCLFYLHVPLLEHSSAEQQRRTSPFSLALETGEDKEEEVEVEE